METSALIRPTLVPINQGIITEDNKLKDILGVSQEDWDLMNTERKAVLDTYKMPFIEGAINGDDKPPFTKAQVMQTLQETMSQQGILLLATECIGNILQAALGTAAAMTKSDPLEELLKKLMQGDPQRPESSDDDE